MALIKCPECDHTVSDAALACPSCGHPLEPRRQEADADDNNETEQYGRKNRRTGCLIVAAIIAIAVVILIAAAEHSQESSYRSNSDWKSYQGSTDPGSMIVKRCAAEAGIPANEPNHQITPQEMQRLATCIDRYR
jgi:hypothetical protein